MFRNLSAKPFGVQLLSFVFLCLIGAVLSMAASYLALIGTGLSMKQYQAITDYNTASWVTATVRLQIASSICMFGVPAILFAYMAYPQARKYLGLRRPPKMQHIILGILALLVSYGLVAYLAQINKAIPMPQSFIDLESKASDMTKALLNFKSTTQLLITLFYIALLPALLEELFFRACLQNILLQHFTQAKAWHAIIITAVIFALLHGQMQTVLPRIFLGLLLGLLYYYSSSLWVSVIAHFFNNAFQVVLNYLFRLKKVPVDISENPQVSVWIALTSTVLCCALVYAMYKQKENYICHVVPSDEQLDKHI